MCTHLARAVFYLDFYIVSLLVIIQKFKKDDCLSIMFLFYNLEDMFGNKMAPIDHVTDLFWTRHVAGTLPYICK